MENLLTHIDPRQHTSSRSGPICLERADIAFLFSEALLLDDEKPLDFVNHSKAIELIANLLQFSFGNIFQIYISHLNK